MVNRYTEHVFKEKARIGRLSQIRELVFGAQDGLLVPLGVVSSVAGAFSNNHIVIVAGISEALAGAFSMGTGAYLAAQAEGQVFEKEMRKESNAYTERPEEEIEEMRMLFERDGLERSDALQVSKILTKSKRAFINTMIQKELGLEPNPPGSATYDALYVGVSYLIAATVPIIPYFFIPTSVAIYISIALTLFALFCIGLLKAKFAALNYLRSGLEILLIGAGSGVGGYLIGVLLPHILGIK